MVRGAEFRELAMVARLMGVTEKRGHTAPVFLIVAYH